MLASVTIGPAPGGALAGDAVLTSAGLVVADDGLVVADGPVEGDEQPKSVAVTVRVRSADRNLDMDAPASKSLSERLKRDMRPPFTHGRA
jgi:hypothetical protein